MNTRSHVVQTLTAAASSISKSAPRFAMFAAAALFVPSAARAQTVLAETFEVSSVKMNTQVDGPRGVIVDQGRFTATGQLLSDGGPTWMTTTRFDIVATTKGLPSLTMLKALLQDRFKIVQRRPVGRRRSRIPTCRLASRSSPHFESNSA